MAAYWLIFSLCLTFAYSKLLAAAVIPHGDFAYDPSLVNNENGSLELHEACVQLGSTLDAMDIDVYLMSTPHGIAFSHSFAVYQASSASGYSYIGMDLHNASYPGYNIYVNATSDSQMATDILESLIKKERDVEGLVYFGNSEPIAIRWGEVIPLAFVNKSLEEGRKVIFWSMPRKRVNHSIEMIPDLLQAGADVYDLMETSPLNFAFLVSADLAHTYPGGPYPPSPTAQPFDTACEEWATTLNEEELLIKAASLVNEALSCGYTGLVMMEGLLERAANVAGMSKTNFWHNTMLYNAHPTYFGMMAASFFPRY